jgi:hypothetical protein
MGFAPQIYVIVQGYIDSKDDRGRSINGAFVSVASRRDIVYQIVLFGQDSVQRDMSWRDIMRLYGEVIEMKERDPLMVHYEEELNKYLETSMILTGVAKNLNAKPAEQAISRFCIEHLKLKSVCFANFAKASESELEAILGAPALAPAESVPGFQEERAPEEDVPSARILEGREEKAEKGIFVRCEPVLDPIGGIAMNDLTSGEYIYGRLAPDSIVYKLLAKNNRNFDGIISAQVSGIIVNELGTATVSLLLSDGVAGVMKLSGKVRVKTSLGPVKNERAASNWGSGSAGFPPELLFAGIGIVLVVSAIFVLYNIFLL